jgi:hypothetical protein
MPVVIDINKLDRAFKEIDKHYTKEFTTLKQTIARLEQRVASLEKPQTPMTKQS